MSKTEADWCKKIEIWWLLRDMSIHGTTYKSTTISWGDDGSRGSISARVSLYEEKYVQFIYTQTDNTTGEKKDFDYKVQLVETPCHLGGTRFWFECPLFKKGQYCGRRVGVLYKDGDYFGCRHCYELTYSSRNKNRNHYLNSLFRVLEIEMEEEKLYKKAKRFTYKGKPTKIRQKIAKLDGEMFRSYRQYTQLEKGVRLGTKGRKK
jgi:hypothetical protein